ncbi:MAG: AraC family transcriptional regulator, partial [Flavobacteriaceae bacterium]
MKLHIKNMVCKRCILVVKSELEKLGLNYLSVELGEVTFQNEISQNDKIGISKHLEALGFEILNDTNSKI